MLMGSPADLMALATSFRPLPVTTETTVAPFFDETKLAGLLDGSRAGDAGGLAEDAAGAAKQLLCGQDLFVGDVDGKAVGLADGHEGLIGVARHADGDGVGDGVLLHRLPGLVLLDGTVDGVAAGGLGGDEPWQLVDEADGVQVLQALPHARDRAAVADGDGQIIGHFPVQLLGDLERDGLLALGEVRVDGRVAVVPAPLFDGLGRHLEGLLVVALDGDDVRAEDHQLRDLALRGALGDEDVGLEARGSGVAGQGGRGVARGRAGDDLRARLMRLGDGHGGGAVFQGSGGVDAVVLDPQTAKTQLLGELRLFVQRAPAHAQRRVGRGLLDGQQLAVAPHGGVHAVFERLLGEMRLDVVVIVNDIQNTAAGAVGQVRHRLIFLAAAHAARTFDVFQHNFLLFSKDAGMGRTPPPQMLVG